MLAGLSVTVNVRVAVSPVSPSVTLGELIDRVGVSLSAIVPVPVAVEIGVFDGFGLLSVICTVSLPSISPSPVTETSKVLLVSPAENVSVPPVIAT